MSATSRSAPTKTPIKAAAASFVGSAVEYYDFFIFGSAAALIFPHVFFPDGDASSQIMSFATFGVAYIARPLGAVILGHFGDKVGRQRVLMFTLVLMGVATFAIGALPTFNQVGWLSPALLVTCRILQGLSAAGEQAGASSLSLEHAPDRQRSFYTSWTLTGTQGGQVLGALVFIPFFSLPHEALYSWGWRVPFFLSAVVVIVAYIIRRTLEEPPEFATQKESGAVAKIPVVDLITHHWGAVLRVICCAIIAGISTIFANLALAYGKSVGLDEGLTLWLVVVANIGAMFTQPFFGKLADSIGRKPVFIYGALATAVMMPFYVLSMSSDNTLLIFVLAVATFSFGYGAANAVWPSFYAEMFSSRVRFSGMAIGTQLGFLMAGFAPTIATSMGGAEEGGWTAIAGLTAVIAVVASISALTAKETKDTPTSMLGVKQDPKAELVETTT